MRKRRGVILVMYDLPVQTNSNRKAGEKFRKYLIRHGYIFVQKSVYAKLIRNRRNMLQEISLLKKEIPQEGIINVLPLRLDEFFRMETILGEAFKMSLFADDIIVI